MASAEASYLRLLAQYKAAPYQISASDGKALLAHQFAGSQSLSGVTFYHKEDNPTQAA
jgi:hypothetical protein